VRLGFVLGSAAECDLALLVRLGGAALASGHEVAMFLMHDAAALAARPELTALCDAGAEATVCGRSAAQRGISLADGALSGSQLDHAALVERCDRVLTLA
jgi:hypothetical protein